MTEKVKENFAQSLWFGAYWGLVSAILRTTFKDAFSFSGPVAFALALLITSLIAYPIFVRGTPMARKFWFMKFERFSFWHHAAISLFVFAVSYIVARIFGWN